MDVKEGFQPQVGEREQVRIMTSRSWNDRLFDPISDENASKMLMQNITKWKNDGSTIVFSSGVFDLMHLTHIGYLLNTKLQGTPMHYEKSRMCGDKAWDTLDSISQMEVAENILATDGLKLIISVDGDDWVMKRKGFNPEKGNSTRPVHSWLTRARNVACATYDDAYGQVHRTADAVTLHDKVSLEGSVHEDTVPLVSYISPDVWSVFYESKDIINELRQRNSLPFEVRILQAGDYFEDKLVGNFSTTAVVKRILNGSNS